MAEAVLVARTGRAHPLTPNRPASCTPVITRGCALDAAPLVEPRSRRSTGA